MQKTQRIIAGFMPTEFLTQYDFKTHMKKLVIFDYDGVICDSFEAGVVIGKDLDPLFSAEIYRRLFDGNAVHTFANSMNEADLRNWIDTHSRIYHTQPLFPGITETLDALSKLHNLSIVSSNLNPLIDKHSLEQNIRHHFSDIMGSDIAVSKIEKIQMLMDKYEVAPSECIFITDTLGDVREANECGIDIIAVLWGFHDRETLNRGTVAHHADSPHDLPDLIARHFSDSCSCKKASE